MSLLNQKTLKNSVQFKGVGLHSGKVVNLTIKPAEPDSGIVFKRIDLNKNNIVYPTFLNVSNTSLNTTISNDFGVKVSTIEHLMGALFIIGIDNALIEIDNEEVPILDGSAKEFVEKILSTDLVFNNKPIKIIKINKKIEFRDGPRYASIEPSKLSLDIEFELNYNNQIIGNQKEFVNHKILDCIGDLFTSGYRIIGSVKTLRGGHYLTNQLLRKIFNDNTNFSIVEIQEKNLPHTLINKSLLRSIA